MALPQIELASGYRRQTPLVWSGVQASENRDLGHDLISTSEAPVFLGVHPRQSDSSLQGALALISDLESVLREFCGFEAYLWGSGSVEEALHFASQLSQKWKDIRQCSPFQQIVYLHSAEEWELLPSYAAQPGWHQLSVNLLRKDLALLKPYPGATVILTNAALENLAGALGSVIAAARSLGCLCGLAHTDLHWLAAGFWPPNLGFDFAVIDLSPWTGSEGGLTVLACSAELEPFLPQPRWRSTESGYSLQMDRVLSIGWNAGPLGQLPLIAATNVSLRTLGGEGLKKLSRQASIHAAYVEKEASARCGPKVVSSSLQKVWVSAYRQSVHLRGWETEADLQQSIDLLAGR